ncbi:TATA element modulatory factor-like [Panicum virgatum]|uniref:TATA element modulatory factor-like n=1 Tax=Panicum virgatum TaxID=38727 RepID=UPI0019D6670A|nr:TATA element modulatory factor-like [Panicum virgatum]
MELEQIEVAKEGYQQRLKPCSNQYPKSKVLQSAEEILERLSKIYAASSDLNEDSMLLAEKNEELANQSAVKSRKLKEVEEGLQLMVDKKSQLKEKTQEVDDLWNKHDTIEFEHRQEKELLKKEIESLAKDNKALKEKNQSLQEKNKSIVKNHKDEVERLTKIMEHADVQLVQCMQQIKDLVAEKDICNKELADLKTAAQAVVDMVDPPEGSVEEGRILLERL